MILLYILLILLALFIVTDLVQGIRVTMFAVLNSDMMKISITFLYPLLKATVDMENGTFYLSVYLLKLKLFTSKLIRRKISNIKRLFKSVRMTDLELSSSYGFKDPSVTGLISGAYGILSSFVHIRRLTLIPDFLSDEHYFLVDASANIKVGHTIWDYLRNRA